MTIVLVHDDGTPVEDRYRGLAGVGRLCGEVYNGSAAKGPRSCALDAGHAVDHADRRFGVDGTLPRGTFIWANNRR